MRKSKKEDIELKYKEKQADAETGEEKREENLSDEELIKLFRETPFTVEKLEKIDTQLNIVEEKLLWILSYLQKLKLRDYLLLLEKPAYLLWVNFLAGIARGFGMAIGFTVLGAFVILILQQMEVLNLPIIGKFISELLKYINVNNLNTRV